MPKKNACYLMTAVALSVSITMCKIFPVDFEHWPFKCVMIRCKYANFKHTQYLIFDGNSNV